MGIGKLKARWGLRELQFKGDRITLENKRGEVCKPLLNLQAQLPIKEPLKEN